MRKDHPKSPHSNWVIRRTPIDSTSRRRNWNFRGLASSCPRLDRHNSLEEEARMFLEP